MSTSVFAQTIAKAISEYRKILRKRLSQPNRRMKLNALNLKDPSMYENEVALYRIAEKIIKDIETTMPNQSKNYYTYSGMDSFCNYLKKFLAAYEIKSSAREQYVIHKGQESSRALLKALQLLEAPLDEKNSHQLESCTITIAQYATKDQISLYQTSLGKIQEQTDKTFYSFLLNKFNTLIESKHALKVAGKLASNTSVDHAESARH